MKYDPGHHYRGAIGIMAILITPFYFYFTENHFKAPIIVLFTIIIVGTEYSYFLPRQALKIYEEIKFKSLLERINTIIGITILIFFSGSEIYSFATNNNICLFISLVIFILWNVLFENQSIILGTNSIIIGKRLISYNLLGKITYEKKKLIIVTNEKTFEIYNWTIGKKRSELESFKIMLDDKLNNKRNQ